MLISVPRRHQLITCAVPGVYIYPFRATPDLRGSGCEGTALHSIANIQAYHVLLCVSYVVRMNKANGITVTEHEDTSTQVIQTSQELLEATKGG
jgi:hypothetical protein